MTTYRWTTHRIYDAAGNDYCGTAPISLWWMALAAAEETLQGVPLGSAWLKLFRTQLSTQDEYWLRWRDDLAESTELRRAYSGLYGRFTARALLTQHLKLSQFIPLGRNGVTVPNSITIARSSKGDIPDWLAWDDRNSRFVLCEAKGSLSAVDFLENAGPKCVHEGKAQFGRVTATINGVRGPVRLDQWVAATKWATDKRGTDPVTVLWDPPGDEAQFPEQDVERHRAAINLAWLSSIAPGLGARDANDLMSLERRRILVRVEAKPGAIEEGNDWLKIEDPPGVFEAKLEKPRVATVPGVSKEASRGASKETSATRSDKAGAALSDFDPDILEIRPPETSSHAGEYIAALVTRFGMRPIRTSADLNALKREQERAMNLEEPAMLIALSPSFDGSKKYETEWQDGAGIASSRLSLFDLRAIELDSPGNVSTPRGGKGKN